MLMKCGLYPKSFNVEQLSSVTESVQLIQRASQLHVRMTKTPPRIPTVEERPVVDGIELRESDSQSVATKISLLSNSGRVRTLSDQSQLDKWVNQN